MRDNDLGLKGVSLVSPDLPPLAPLDLEIAAGEHVALLERGDGAASTLLRLAAGFVRPDIGRVIFAGRDLTDRPPGERPTRWVATGLGLFPAASLVDNVADGLPPDVRGRAERREAALALLARHGLGARAERRPVDLAPAEAVVAALLRAIAGRPSVLLLERPFLGVPVAERPALRETLATMRREIRASVVERCDAPAEALAFADRIALFRHDRLLQFDTPDRVRSAPVSVAAARLTGEIDVVPGRLLERDGDHGRVETPFGVWRGRLLVEPCGERVAVAFRPERVDLVDLEADADPQRPSNRVEADFVERRLGDGVVRLVFAAAERRVSVLRPDRGMRALALGARTTLGVAAADTWILPPVDEVADAGR